MVSVNVALHHYAPPRNASQEIRLRALALNRARLIGTYTLAKYFVRHQEQLKTRGTRTYTTDTLANDLLPQRRIP